MPYRTLIFDLDGTISDPSCGIARSVNFALQRFGYRTVDPARIHALIGPPLTEIFRHFLGDLADSRRLELVAAYRERYAATGYRENVLYPGIADALDSLAARFERLGVCTSKRADYAAKIVEMFGFGTHFAFVDGGDVDITKAMQLERLVADGLDPATAVMIGDRAVDIEAARANGIDSIGAGWGFAAPRELEAAAPTHIARTPAELLEVLE